jgi:hypothetical protein
MYKEVFLTMILIFLLGEYISDAAKVGQEAVVDAAKATKEYASAGAHKTQEAFNEYVR